MNFVLATNRDPETTRTEPTKTPRLGFSERNIIPNRKATGTSRFRMTTAGPARLSCRDLFKKHCPTNEAIVPTMEIMNPSLLARMKAREVMPPMGTASIISAMEWTAMETM